MRLAAITIYPVKSTAGLALDATRVTARGLEHDRRWMLAQPDGEFISARHRPALVRVRARIAGRGLTFCAPGHEPHALENAHGGEPIRVRVWGDEVAARRVNPRTDAWFSGVLGEPCRLVYMADDDRRAVDPEFGNDGDEVSFADGFPLLLTSEASLADLGARMAGPVEMARFRPNVTVEGSTAFAEDRWRRIRIGAVAFDVVKPCERCVMTTIDPATGVPHPGREPLRTLASYRRDPARGILFGVNLIARGAGTLHVGDPVEVVAET